MEVNNQKVDVLTDKVDRLSWMVEKYITKKTGHKPADDDPEARNVDFSCDENEERGNWSGRLDFLLACLGYAVGLGNVWRFPYLCYKNGGAVFFIPYVLCLGLIGIPIFMLELSLGQYTSNGPLTCWEMAPLFKGVGVGMVIVSGLVGIYYNMIIAWAIFYMCASFRSVLPWTECDSEWASKWCSDYLNLNMTEADCISPNTASNGTCYINSTDTPYGIYNKTVAKEHGMKANLPTEDYYNRYVLGIQNSSGLDDMGAIRWQLVLCYLLAWIIVILSLVKGIKSSGKVVYFTALFPYLVLVILFVKGLTLEGSGKGIEFYILQPKLERLLDIQVWKDAAVQIFFSLSASWGGLIALSSYNRFHNDCLRDTLIVSIGNCLTSFFAGFVIFSFLGFMADKVGSSVEDVVDSGVGLAFIVYPYAVTLMPVSVLWAILFFLMLITLGLDSEFALLETVTTSIMDQFPRTRDYKWAVILVTAIIMFILGLTMTTEGGARMLQLLDDYAGGWNVLVIALCECICIAYVYGVNNFTQDIEVMLGKEACGCCMWGIWKWAWSVCWCFFTPVCVFLLLIASWVFYSPSKYDDVVLPVWANALGWLCTFTVIVAIIVTPLIMLCMGSDDLGDRFKALVTPTRYWGPALTKHRRMVKHMDDFELNPWGEERGYDNEAVGHDGSFNKGFDGHLENQM